MPRFVTSLALNHFVGFPPSGAIRWPLVLATVSVPQLLIVMTCAMDTRLVSVSGGFPILTSLLLPALISPLATMLIGARTDWLELVAPLGGVGVRILAYFLAVIAWSGLSGVISRWGLRDLGRDDIFLVQGRNIAAFLVVAAVSAVLFGISSAWLLPLAWLVAVVFTGGSSGQWWSWPLDPAYPMQVFIAWAVLGVTVAALSPSRVQRLLGI